MRVVNTVKAHGRQSVGFSKFASPCPILLLPLSSHLRSPARRLRVPRVFAWMCGLIIASLIAAAPPLYHVYLNRTYRNFRAVRPGVLYRSGQMSRAGLERIIHDYGIRCVITLRDADAPGQLPPDWEEEEYCLKEELYYF